jgi:hypothetical protein
MENEKNNINELFKSQGNELNKINELFKSQGNELNKINELFKPKTIDGKTDNIKNLANNLKLDDSTMDLGSIMSLASNLLNNDAVMKSLQGLGALNQSLPGAVPEEQKQETTELNMIRELIERTMVQINLELMKIHMEIQVLTNELNLLKAVQLESKENSKNLLDFVNENGKYLKKRK